MNDLRLHFAGLKDYCVHGNSPSEVAKCPQNFLWQLPVIFMVASIGWDEVAIIRQPLWGTFKGFRAKYKAPTPDICSLQMEKGVILTSNAFHIKCWV